MRKYISLLTAVVVLALIASSCKKDEDPDPGEALIGNWTTVKFTYVDCDDPDNDMEETCSGEVCEDGLVVTSTHITIQGVDTYEYTVSGNNLTIMLGSSISINATYSITGSTLTVTFPDFEDGCTFIQTYTRA